MKLSTPYEHHQWLMHGTERVEVQDTEAMRAVRAFANGPLDRWLLVLAGRGTGSGKSFAAAWGLERLHERVLEQHPAVVQWLRRAASSAPSWVTCASLSSLRGKYPSEQEQTMARIRGCWLLVLDDVGTEPDAGVVQAVLEHRRAENLLTIVTTNLVDTQGPRAGKASKEWFQRYDRRLSSRMASPGDHEAGALSSWVHCVGPDLRSQAQPRILEAPGDESTLVDADIDAIVLPLLQKTDPEARHREHDERRREQIEADKSGLESIRATVWARMVLEEVEIRAADGDETAKAILAAVQRRQDEAS